MWKCEHCGEIFEYPDNVSYCLEEYNGVTSLFPDRHYGSYVVCPECGSQDIDTYYEDEESEDEEWDD